ncbi:hypothetical protein [Paenibacillus cineris]|uniref:HEPN domain-containing protein n=1 Tax=Paenibacillus cineris TaxID=237530 RepID=A0ABQ4LKA6_9BACL|nr:hypothetical protein [Paenibacillus cineris]GIO56897.1 hypothetical protein J21TS7_52150 [Paenibacillus cineris]
MKSIAKSDIEVTRQMSHKQEKPGFIYQETIHRLNNSAQEYMRLSVHFLEESLLHVSLLLCNRALECMLHAIHIKQQNQLHTTTMLLDDILQDLSDEMGMEAITFIQSLSYLSQERLLISKMQPTHLMNLIKRADDLLLRLSDRLHLPSETYHSVFFVEMDYSNGD